MRDLISIDCSFDAAACAYCARFAFELSTLIQSELPRECIVGRPEKGAFGSKVHIRSGAELLTLSLSCAEAQQQKGRARWSIELRSRVEGGFLRRIFSRPNEQVFEDVRTAVLSALRRCSGVDAISSLRTEVDQRTGTLDPQQEFTD